MVSGRSLPPRTTRSIASSWRLILASPTLEPRARRLPVTSTIRGVPSEVVLNEEDGMKSPCAVNLHHAVTVSQQRLGKRVAQLSSARMNEVCAALRFSLGCDAN